MDIMKVVASKLTVEEMNALDEFVERRIADAYENGRDSGFESGYCIGLSEEDY